MPRLHRLERGGHVLDLVRHTVCAGDSPDYRFWIESLAGEPLELRVQRPLAATIGLELASREKTVAVHLLFSGSLVWILREPSVGARRFRCVLKCGKRATKVVVWR